MTDKKPDLVPPLELRQAALSTWHDEGGAVPRPPKKPSIPEVTEPAIPLLTNTELVRLRVRVIALENLVITMLAEACRSRLARWHPRRSQTCCFGLAMDLL
jgi:hypothetical protein